MTIETEAFTKAIKSKLGIQILVAVAKKQMPVELLSPDEKAIFETWNHPVRQQHWLMGRNALKQVLHELGENQDTSVLKFPHNRYSLTHSQDLAIAIGIDAAHCNNVTGVGIDFENHRDIKDGALKFFLSEREKALLSQCDTPQNRLKLWTLKEALYKADSQNTETSYTDYELDNLNTDTGTAECKTTQKQFYYFSMPAESGFISIALTLK